MKLKDISQRLVNQIDPDLLSWGFKQAQRVPFLKKKLEQEYDSLLSKIEPSIKPYRSRFPGFNAIPRYPVARDEVLQVMTELSQLEEIKWRDGFVSGSVYQGDGEHIDFLNRVYALHSQSNPLHADVWPSSVKFDAEIVAMTARMLGAPPSTDGQTAISGVVTSGGTESLLLAMKAYRDRAAAEHGITTPEIVAPTTAHVALDKAAECFKINLIRVPPRTDFRADIEATRAAITRNTIALVGSAPTFPHGVIDPIAELADLAVEHQIGFHVDACLGGFLLPWAERLGHSIPAFDFRLPGVSSISADTHKYGYAPKGTSVVLYRGRSLRHYQYFAETDWPGGLYFSPTLAGSRPGALSACCWAALIATGEEGYLDATRRILETAKVIRDGIEGIEGLRVLGDPLWVIAFSSTSLDIYRILDSMTARGWSLNGLQRPPSIHVCTTLRHAEPGVAARFVADLRAATEEVETSPPSKAGMAPIYGLAGTLPLRGAVKELLLRYIDLLYRP